MYVYTWVHIYDTICMQYLQKTEEDIDPLELKLHTGSCKLPNCLMSSEAPLVAPEKAASAPNCWAISPIQRDNSILENYIWLYFKMENNFNMHVSKEDDTNDQRIHGKCSTSPGWSHKVKLPHSSGRCYQKGKRCVSATIWRCREPWQPISKNVIQERLCGRCHGGSSNS